MQSASHLGAVAKPLYLARLMNFCLVPTETERAVLPPAPGEDLSCLHSRNRVVQAAADAGKWSSLLVEVRANS